MLMKKILFMLILLAMIMTLCIAESIEGLPLHVKKIGTDVIRIWAGDYISSTAVSAIATQKGIVVIDSTELPVLDQAFRKLIAKEFGRTDFIYLINTHGHADHTNGNSVYADCRIIAHESVPEMIKENFNQHTQQIDWITKDNQRQNDRIASGKLNPEEIKAARERLIINSLSLKFFQSAAKPQLPSQTFREKLILDCQDTTFELYQCGGTHTKSDSMIYVPQKKILFTGDMMADKWLSDTPGCLATFAIRSGSQEDYLVLVKNWQYLLKQKNNIDLYIPGHWNGELSASGFENRFNYLNTMLNEIKKMAAAGSELSKISETLALKSRFPQLENSPGISERGHQMSIHHLYQLFSGKISLAAALQKLFQAADFNAEFNTLQADLLKNKKNYFYDENEINNLGYFLLHQQKQISNAMMLFELNLKLHPNSWNAFDSLAEVWYVQGNHENALKFYQKSVELNPDNENGKKFIDQIKKELEKK
jgi:glyoxylase-like metal-dependent hydrolase (beta-lactamase superfamily II)